jgi:hypothetical protein
MAEEKHIYTKSSPERDHLPLQEKQAISGEHPHAPLVDIQSSEYQKPDISEQPKAFFIIISGGEVREKDYFRLLSFKDKFNRIKLDFIADPLKLSPDGMYELAEYKKAHYDTSRDEDSEPDQMYLLSDVDHFKSELLRIKPKCESVGFHLIISNSCFEVWLYYAYHDVIPSITLPQDALKISGKFKGWLPSVIPGGVKPRKAILSIYQNIENAKKNYNIDENGIPLLFSTNMHLLAENLLPLIEPELTQMIEEVKKLEAEFRSKKNK